MTQIIQKVKLRNIKCQFQKDLNDDISSVKRDNRLFVKADKSTNFYKLEAAKYNQLLNDNITKAYKKADDNQLKKIDTEAKAIPSPRNLKSMTGSRSRLRKKRLLHSKIIKIILQTSPRAD